MTITVGTTVLSKAPSKFSVTIADLDDGESTTRTSDGYLWRDRIAVKRKINIGWDLVEWSVASEILQAFSDVFFDVTYPDPQTGAMATIECYAGDRPTAVAIDLGDGELWWSGLEFNLIER